MKSPESQKGFAVFVLVITVLAAVLAMSSGMAFIVSREQRVLRSRAWSAQAAYAAGAGLEDAFLRIKNGMSRSNPILLSVGEAEAETEISDSVGGVRTITAEGNRMNRIRKLQTVFGVDGDEGSFFYGAQAGEGGVRLSNLSSIIGGVFSNGNINADAGTEVTGTVLVSGAGEIDGGNIGGDARAVRCEGTAIQGTLFTNENDACTAPLIESLGDPLDPVPLPVSSEMIGAWKQAAEAGGVINGDYILSGSSQAELGPVKIQGNLALNSQARLTVTGTIWVTGSITLSNLAEVRLAPGYGSSSGAVISDGVVTLKNLSVSRGTGQEGSYLMYVSTLAADPAIVIKNNARADILFTDSGWIEIQNNAELREVAGYGIHTKNNAELQYETGLDHAFFVSGASGGWSVFSWKEVE